MWEALEAASFAQHLRASQLSYPLVSALHIVGLALLFGGIVPVDLRLLGLWPDVPREALLKTCRKVAVAGLALSISMGFLLFATRATEYAAAPPFQIKISLLCLALLNIALAARALASNEEGRLRLHAGLSIILWLSVIFAGRAIAYF